MFEEYLAKSWFHFLFQALAVPLFLLGQDIKKQRSYQY